MKKILTIAFSLVMLASLPGCPENPFDKKKGGGGGAAGPVATAPPTPADRGGCKYDYNERRYRYDNGESCSYDQYYDADACYNFYYDIRWERYYNENGDPVTCNQDYINYNNVIPYYNYNYDMGYSYFGCPAGYNQVPVGFGYFVCAANPSSTNSLNLNWWFWLNL